VLEEQERAAGPEHAADLGRPVPLLAALDVMEDAARERRVEAPVIEGQGVAPEVTECGPSRGSFIECAGPGNAFGGQIAAGDTSTGKGAGESAAGHANTAAEIQDPLWFGVAQRGRGQAGFQFCKMAGVLSGRADRGVHGFAIIRRVLVEVCFNRHPL
jgi:hypothetical protein